MWIYYLLPLANHDLFFVILTFNHHTDEETLWMDDSTWSFLIGVLTSVDRDYGSIINNLFHHINLHVVHHLCQEIPHYKTYEVTQAFKARWPDMYIKADHENGFLSFFRMWRIFAWAGYQEQVSPYWGFKCGGMDRLDD